MALGIGQCKDNRVSKFQVQMVLAKQCKKLTKDRPKVPLSDGLGNWPRHLGKHQG